MKRNLMDLLVCPICRGGLYLTVESETEAEVTKGTLTCRKCKTTFPVDDGIPNLLPPQLRGKSSNPT